MLIHQLPFLWLLMVSTNHKILGTGPQDLHFSWSIMVGALQHLQPIKDFIFKRWRYTRTQPVLLLKAHLAILRGKNTDPPKQENPNTVEMVFNLEPLQLPLHRSFSFTCNLHETRLQHSCWHCESEPVKEMPVAASRPWLTKNYKELSDSYVC